jgi:DNA-binding response OmpR family regulator
LNSPNPSPPADYNAGPPLTVLVIEAEPPLARMLKLGLELNGITTLTAADGPSGLALFDAQGAAIGAAVIDVHLTDGNGLDTFHALRQRRPDLPCCLLVGSMTDFTAEQLQGRGAEVVTKPFRLAQLAATLRRITGRENG